MIQHNHSLIIIKNSAPGIKTKYLTYYDERWDCKLFPNLKTADKDNEAFIISNLSNDLGIPKKEIKCKYISSRVQEKYSVSHGENRVYNHRLYELKIHHFPEQTRQTDFVLNGRHYYWMTLEEMEHDENIEKKNNLMYIQKGTTVINIKVPYVWQGAIVSIAGIILSVVWVIALGKTGKSGKNKNENI